MSFLRRLLEIDKKNKLRCTAILDLEQTTREWAAFYDKYQNQLADVAFSAMNDYYLEEAQHSSDECKAFRAGLDAGIGFFYECALEVAQLNAKKVGEKKE